MTFARGARLVSIAIAAVVLGASCSSEPATEFQPGVIDTTPPASTSSTTRSVSATTTSLRPPPAQWTARSFIESDNGSSRTCIELTTPTTSATSCLTLPGVSTWTVADGHFVFGKGDIALTDGSVIRADASGVAIGLLPTGSAPVSDTRDNCTRASLALAVADHYPGSTVAWVPGRCAGGAASVSAQLADRSEVTALAAQADDGHWEVFATFRPPVRCALLDVMSRNLCKLLRYDD